MNDRNQMYDILLVIVTLGLLYFSYTYWDGQYKLVLDEKNELKKELSIKKEYTEIKDIVNFNKKIAEFTPSGNPKENLLLPLSEIEKRSGAKITKLDIKDGVVQTNSSTVGTEENGSVETPPAPDNVIAEPIKELKFLESQVEIQVTGEFNSIYKFIQYLEEDKRIMDIIQFNYIIPSNSNQIQATIIMKVYAK